MNSLTDREVIDKLSEASCSGVKVDLVIRGICCLLPGVPGKTENITVRCIVGRMLEHARVYMFGVDHDTIYLSSADMMTRNTEHRVEIAYPILDPAIRARVVEDMRIQLEDNVKARILQPDGTYARIPVAEGAPLVDAQQTFMSRALKAANDFDKRLAREERRARKRPIPSGTGQAPDAPAAPPAPAAQPSPAAPPTVEADGAEAREEPQAAAVPDEPRKADEAPQAAELPEGANGAEAGGSTAVETVVVEATTIPAPDEAEEEAKPDLGTSLELMVAQKGRASTGWALIKMGFKVLFGKKLDR